MSLPTSSVNSATARAPALYARALKYWPPFKSSNVPISWSAAAIANLSFFGFTTLNLEMAHHHHCAQHINRRQCTPDGMDFMAWLMPLINITHRDKFSDNNFRLLAR